MGKLLSPSFFNRPTVTVAQELIGCYLSCKINRKINRYLIVETEAYDGFEDRASHAFKGKTKRNAVMFGPPGYIYVYLVYGMHWMFNIVTGPQNYPSAVLIRGIENVIGPARLTKKLRIDKKFDGKKLSLISGLWIESGPRKIPTKLIERSPRIGVDYAGPVWSKKKWRFRLK